MGDFCERNRKGVWMISDTRMPSSKRGPEIMKALLSQSQYGEIKYGPLGSLHVLYIVQGLSKNFELIKQMKEIRNVEESVRNTAAHEIVSVTDDWIYKKVGMHAQDICRLLEKLVIAAGIHIQSRDWDSYDTMNHDIIRALLLPRA